MSQPLPYTIRPMDPGDVPTVVSIDQMSFPTPWRASSYLYELRHPKQSFYFSLLRPATSASAPTEQGWLHRLRGVLSPPQESRVIGYVGFRLRLPEAHISSIAIHPSWRGKGLGELLLLTAMEKALEQEARVVTLEVRSSNQVAQYLYRKYGFQHTGIHRGYYRDGEDAWLMEATVSQDAYRARLTELRHALETRLHNQQEALDKTVGIRYNQERCSQEERG
jgi:ribosomal-protein-alanine N-acetyltransferase